MIHGRETPRAGEGCNDAAVVGTALGYNALSVIQDGVLLRCSLGQPANPSVTFSSSDQTQQILTNRRSLLSRQLENFQPLSFLTFQTCQKRSHILLPRKVKSLSLEFESVIQTSGPGFFFFPPPRSLHNKKHPTSSHLLWTKGQTKRLLLLHLKWKFLCS